MPEPTTAPVTEGLRERVEVSFGPAMRMGLQDAELHGERGTQRIEEWITAITDAVLAALAGDPGDLRKLREAAKDAFADDVRPDGMRLLSNMRSPWRALDDALDAVVSVLPAHHAAALARIRELEADQAAADEEVFHLMAHSDETCSVVAERDRVVAEVERLRAELAEAREDHRVALHTLNEQGAALVTCQHTHTTTERAEKAEAERDYLSSDLQNFMRRNTELIAERDALKAAIAAAVNEIRTWMDPDDPGPLFAPSHAAEVDRTLKKYIGEHVIAALAVPESTESAPTETPEWTETDEMWHMALWLRQDAAPDVCDRIRQVPGVVELYRAYPSPCITPETTPDAPTGGED